MKFKQFALSALICGAFIVLSGCAGVAQVAADVAQAASTSTPTQVTTLAEAEQAATLATKAVDVYVNTANPDKATLLELKSLSDAVHAALVNLEQANTQGASLLYSSFNAALAAFNAYATSQGVTH